MGTKTKQELADGLRAKGFSVLPMPLGGYLITDLGGKPMLAAHHPAVPVHYLAPSNYVDLRPPSPHLYTCEV